MIRKFLKFNKRRTNYLNFFNKLQYNSSNFGEFEGNFTGEGGVEITENCFNVIEILKFLENFTKTDSKRKITQTWS